MFLLVSSTGLFAKVKLTFSAQISPYGLLFDSDVRDVFNENFAHYRVAGGLRDSDNFRVEVGYNSFFGEGHDTNPSDSLNNLGSEVLIKGPDLAFTLFLEKKYAGVGVFSGEAEFTFRYEDENWDRQKICWKSDAFGFRVFSGIQFTENFFVEGFYYFLNASEKTNGVLDDEGINLSHIGGSIGARF